MAALLAETNTFSPLPAGRAAFLGNGFSRNHGSRPPPAWGNIPLIAWRRLAESAGIGVVESITANAEPGGLTTRAAEARTRRDFEAIPYRRFTGR